MPDNSGRIRGVTGVILAGGHSSRMGSNKALLPFQGGRFIEAIHRRFSELFPEVLLVTNNPEQYDFLPCRKVADLYPGMGALAGLHSGLKHAAMPHIFAAACDMPWMNSVLIMRLAGLRDTAEVIIPQGENGLEPLHAVYGKRCLGPMEESLAADRRRIVSFFPLVRVRQLRQEQVAAIDPGFDSFRNVNTPADYFRLRAEYSVPVSETSENGQVQKLQQYR
ncbi:MAG: molybdenum cofactor guanylyltransferase [Geobacteraceae bacterium GWF2_54_21]|nr:MAG: molybdenum cofactor guanylyltransferase [Geobacteraceae bacterium GWF2_54_21]